MTAKFSRPLITLALAALSSTAGCVDGAEPEPSPAPALIRVPDPLSGDNPVYALVPASRPEPGIPLRDAPFGTVSMRVTLAEGLRHEYSRYDPFNRDQSQIVLTDPASGELRVYKAGAPPYDAAGNLVRTADLEQPRWDVADPNVLWGFRDFQIRTIEVDSGKTTVVKDFASDARLAPLLQAEQDLYRITTKDEGESSRDMRYWALALQGSADDYRLRYVFTWDRTTDRVLGLYKLSAAEAVDWVGMSWNGTCVLIGADPGRGQVSGLTMADRELTRFHRLDSATGHADVGLDAAGREVIVMQNARTDYVDLIPLAWNTRIVPEGGSYEGTGRTPLVRLNYDSQSPVGFNAGVHISCNAPGWCVVSPHLDRNVKEQNWLDRNIVLVRLDASGPAAYYLAKVRGACGAYWEETHAVLTNDGSKVLWADNWGRQVGREKSVLMQLNMPDQWRRRLK